MTQIRKAAVADMFYSGDPAELKDQLNEMIGNAILEEAYENIFGIVAPHAGYVYSGQCAAYAYKALAKHEFDTAIILSPSHREYFFGVSIYNGDAYETPFGNVEVDKIMCNQLIEFGDNIFASGKGHGAEHAVEVQVPFLQMVRSDFKIVPMVIGDQRKEIVDELSAALAQVAGSRTIIIASTDLSHFYSKDIAEKIDSRAEDLIANFDYDQLQKDLDLKNCQACGGGGVVALLKAAHGLDYSKSKILCRTDSGDVSGDNSSVVGYLSAVIYK